MIIGNCLRSESNNDISLLRDGCRHGGRFDNQARVLSTANRRAASFFWPYRSSYFRNPACLASASAFA
jgi:hypothetical protein